MATKKQAATTRIHRTKAAITSAPAVDPVEETVDPLTATTTELRIAEQAKLAGQPVTIVPASLARADADEKQAKAAAKPKAPKPTKLCHKCGENPRHTQPGGATLSLCFPCFKTYHLEYSAMRKAKKETPA